MIRLSKSCLSDREKQAVMGVLDREYLGMGDEVRKFEEALTAFFGRPAVCVNTGTAALHLALEALRLCPGDEVLVPSLTYVASFQAITAAGLKPVACDVSLDTGGLDPQDLKRRVTSRTKAIMPVHYCGGVGALDEIYDFAKSHGIRVIEDAAHAFGTTWNGAVVGRVGDIACFSFDGIKNITSGEGGCVVTDDDAVLQRVRDARLLGVKNDTEKRYAGARSWQFDVDFQGYRYHMSNIMAAIGLEQLKRFEGFAKRRQLLAGLYQKSLAPVSALRLFNLNYEEVVPHIFVVRLIGQDRTAIQDALLKKGIQTGLHYFPNHLLTLFGASQSTLPFPHTEELAQQMLTLPLHPDLSETDVFTVIDSLNEVLT